MKRQCGIVSLHCQTLVIELQYFPSSSKTSNGTYSFINRLVPTCPRILIRAFAFHSPGHHIWTARSNTLSNCLSTIFSGRTQEGGAKRHNTPQNIDLFPFLVIRSAVGVGYRIACDGREGNVETPGPQLRPCSLCSLFSG